MFRNFRNADEEIYLTINGKIAKEGGLEEADVAIIKYMRPVVSSVPVIITVIGRGHDIKTPLRKFTSSSMMR